ncbi:hypothetical protein BLNAU_22850 [Blattamonas nauphoetae]|uniref:Uncharacterized protein n=1 Tax=Blattamonas nauphoetae TaxID=2049346 RepID=A0ABQ9WSD6_9EUKA|nr:hypothetical protein BLNAU_22850 [Blattamonas nauphoetae]
MGPISLFVLISMLHSESLLRRRAQQKSRTREEKESVELTATTKFRSLINSLADILPDPRGMIDGRPQSNIEVFLRRRMLDDSIEGPTPEVVSSSPSKTEGGHDKSNTEHSSSKPNHALNSPNSPPIPKFEINPDKETIPASQRKDAPVKISPRLKHRLGGNQNTGLLGIVDEE